MPYKTCHIKSRTGIECILEKKSISVLLNIIIVRWFIVVTSGLYKV